MKHFYLIAVSILLINFSFASPINGLANNGPWKNSTTWDKNRKPQNGDTVVIPAGKIIVVNSWENLDNVFIKVYGTLKFTNIFTALDLNAASRVAVYSGGTIQATIDFLQYITIGNNTVFMSGQVAGPQIANSATGSGFSGFNPLPVKFVGFTLTRKNNDVLVQWSTSQEVDADMYNVERSIDGENWSTIAYVAAVGNSSNVNNYSFTDKNISPKTVYYRVKEVDVDGKFVYTPVKSIKADATTFTIGIASVQNKILLQFPKEVKGNIVVRFVSLNGQVLDQQTINNPVGQVVLNSKHTGNYIIISLSNGTDINTAKQVIL